MTRGLPPAASLSDPAPVLSSHTSTDQWQSFEMRMRRRRAERCVLRAQVALEAGFPEDARAALDEARRLDSSTPDFETLSASVVVEEPVVVAEPVVVEGPLELPAREPRSLVPLISVAAVLIAVVGIGAFGLSRGTRTTASQFSAGPVPSAPLPSAQEPSAPVPAAVAIAATPAERDSPEPAVPVGKEPERRPQHASLPTLIATPAATTVAIGKAIPKPAPPVVAEPKPPESRSTEPAAITLEPAQPLVLASSSGPSLTLPEAPAPDERPRVRAALARYEAGYSALNVAAVQAVWPAVDSRSLSRAFDGLASQRFALGQCSMAIETTSATATCNGTASFTPKIGGGVRSEGRRWTFDLRRVDGEWQIVRVSTR